MFSQEIFGRPTADYDSRNIFERPKAANFDIRKTFERPKATDYDGRKMFENSSIELKFQFNNAAIRYVILIVL